MKYSTPIGQACVIGLSLELEWGQLHLNYTTEGSVEGSHPKIIRLLPEDLGMEAEQRKTEAHHNLEKLFQI